MRAREIIHMHIEREREREVESREGKRVVWRATSSEIYIYSISQAHLLY